MRIIIQIVRHEDVYNEKILLLNIDKINTTKIGINRIKKNLKLDKNWYCEIDNIVITIKSYSYKVITTHIKR